MNKIVHEISLPESKVHEIIEALQKPSNHLPRFTLTDKDLIFQVK